MIGAQYVHDHVMHFYHLHALDWVDVVSAVRRPEGDLGPGPVTEQLAQVLPRLLLRRPEASQGLRGVRPARHLRQRLLGPPGLQAPARGQPDGGGPLPGGPGLAARRGPLHAIFGGKNPHPNFVVGGVASPIDLNSDSAINAKRLAEVQTVISSDAPVRGPGLCPGHPGHRRLLQGLGRARRGPRQLPVLRGPARLWGIQDPSTFLFPSRRHPQSGPLHHP
jgi:hydrogenase large subunit